MSTTNNKYGCSIFAANTKKGFIAKILIAVDLVLIIGFVVFSVITLKNIDGLPWMTWWTNDLGTSATHPTPLGWGMMGWGAVILAITTLSIIWLIKDSDPQTKQKAPKNKK